MREVERKREMTSPTYWQWLQRRLREASMGSSTTKRRTYRGFGWRWTSSWKDQLPMRPELSKWPNSRSFPRLSLKDNWFSSAGCPVSPKVFSLKTVLSPLFLFFGRSVRIRFDIVSNFSLVLTRDTGWFGFIYHGFVIIIRGREVLRTCVWRV